MTGASAITLVGSYDTMAEAVVGMNTSTVVAVTDSIDLYIEPGVGLQRYHVVNNQIAA